MSDSNGPVRRRRIAGEAKPEVPAAKKAGPVKKTSAAKKAPVAKKAPDAKKASEPVTAPTARKTPVAKKAPAAKKAPVAASVPPVATSLRKPAVAKPVVSPAPPRTTTTDSRDGGRPSARDLLLLLPLALVAIATLVVGTLLVVDNSSSSSDGDSLATSRRQASSAAASAAETIFSFQYNKLDEHLKASKALMTPTFAKDFDKIAPALTELAPQRKIQVKAVTREAAALPCGDECSPTKASVLVFVDQARLVGSSTTPTVFANRIKVSMVKGKSGWLVNQIDAI